MKFGSAVVAALLLLAGCGAFSAVYVGDGYVVQSAPASMGGRPGPIHPAVLELVFASPDGPFVPFYRALPAAEAQKLKEYRRTSANLATKHFPGEERPGPAILARARARELAPKLQAALARDTGALTIYCCGTVDRETGKLRAGTMRGVHASLMINEKAKIVRLDWNDSVTFRSLSWDLSRVPSAFAPTAQLEYSELVDRASPLHPRQEKF